MQSLQVVKSAARWICSKASSISCRVASCGFKLDFVISQHIRVVLPTYKCRNGVVPECYSYDGGVLGVSLYISTIFYH